MNLIKKINSNNNIIKYKEYSIKPAYNTQIKGRIRQASSVILGMVALVAFFSLVRGVSSETILGSSLSQSPAFCGGCAAMDFSKAKLNMCPIINLDNAKSLAHLEAMKIIKSAPVQKILLDDVSLCPFTSPCKAKRVLDQSWVLTQATINKNINKFLVDHELHREIDGFNNQLSHYTKKLIKGDLLVKEDQNIIDISKLLTENNPIKEPMQTRLIKTFQGLRLARTGDRDIMLIAASNLSADYNQVFHWDNFEKNRLKSLQIISQKYPLHVVEAGDYKELLNAMETTKQKIGNIKIGFIQGHGNQTFLRLGKNRKTGIPGDAIQITTKASEPLPIDQDGTLIFCACSTGEGRLYQKNLVNSMSLLHPGVTVMGATESAQNRLDIHDLDKRQFSFTNAHTNKDITYRAKNVARPSILWMSILSWLTSDEEKKQAIFKHPLSKWLGLATEALEEVETFPSLH